MSISLNNPAVGSPQRRRTLCVVAAALAVSFAALAPVHAANLACKPDIFAKNRKAAAIKVVAFEYTTQASGEGSKSDPFRESLSNKRLAPGEEEDWNKVKLQHAAEDNWIRSTRVPSTANGGCPTGDPSRGHRRATTRRSGTATRGACSRSRPR